MGKAEDKELLKKIGDTLKKIRLGKGLSLRDLAANCSIDYSDIGKIERGEVNATMLTMYQLAQGLDVPLYTLFISEET
jgi:transcriptional regulator with XRE-family HTH domain